ncbi:MAG: glycosyltransferase family A protein [Bacteroidota bacterium]
MSASPDVSAIVPVFNGAAFLREALASLVAQTRPPTEVIVVDDGSTDESGALATSIAETASVPIRVVRQDNRGVSAARNVGIREARGAVLAFLDADDAWTPGRLARQLPLLDADADLVLGHLQVVLPGRAFPADFRPLPEAPAERLPHFGSALIRREVFETVGLLDESLSLSEDVDWFLRATEAGVTVRVDPGVAQLHRRHRASTTAGRSSGQLGLAHVLKRSLDRRRASGETADLPSAFANRP